MSSLSSLTQRPDGLLGPESVEPRALSESRGLWVAPSMPGALLSEQGQSLCPPILLMSGSSAAGMALVPRMH